MIVAGGNKKCWTKFFTMTVLKSMDPSLPTVTPTFTLTSTGARAMAAAAVSRAIATMGATMMAIGLMPPPSRGDLVLTDVN